MAKRGRKPKCPYCGGTHTVSKGVRRTSTMGERPLRFCRQCRRKFTVTRVPVKREPSEPAAASPV